MGKKPKDPKPTAQEIAAGKIAVDQWNEYATKWQQPIKRWAADVAGDKTNQMAQATGITNADLAQQAAGNERGMTAAGFDPNSGKMIAALSGTTDAQAKVGGGAAATARQGVEDARLSGLQAIGAIGMGQKADATAGINQIAAESVARQNLGALTDQQNRFARNNMIGGMAGVAAGAGVEAYTSGGMADNSMLSFDAAGKSAIKAGASSAPGGYSVAGNRINWNQ